MNHWIDYVIFVLFLCISIGIGLFFSLTGGRQRTTEEFIMANRALQVLPTTLSLLVSYQSAIMIIGHTAEIYVGGTSAWPNALIAFTVSLLVVAWLFVPWFYRLKTTSVNKVLELRFSCRLVSTWGAVLSVLSQVIYMGSAMLAPSIALETGTGFPATASIPIMAVVCIVYTTLGGLKAVIWTDVFQSVMMLAGILTILIKGLIVVGGFSEALRLANEGERLTLFDFSADPTVRHTFWGFLFGYSSMWVVIYGIQQASVQRICATRTLRQARCVVLLNLPLLALLSCIVYFNGVVVVAYYIRKGCDPIASGEIAEANNLLPLFVKEVFKNSPGFGGLFLATLYSGALSSVSSSLSGAAANTWDDILRWKFAETSDYKASLISKALVVAYGLVAIALAFMVKEMPGPITQVSLSLNGGVFGPVAGVFLISGIRYFSWCNSKGTISGGCIGLIFVIWQTAGSVFYKSNKNTLPPIALSNCTMQVNATTPLYHQSTTGLNTFYNISYVWKTLSGCVITMLACMICSLLFSLFQKERVRVDLPSSFFLHMHYKKAKQRDKRVEYLRGAREYAEEELKSFKDID